MAAYNSVELTSFNTTPVQKPSSENGYGARLKRYRATIPFANSPAFATSDTVNLANVPVGSSFAFAIVTTDTSLGSTTIQIGDAASAATYVASRTFTATDTPTLMGKTAAIADENATTGAEFTPTAAAGSGSESVFLTFGTATPPTTGFMVVDLYFSSP